MGMIKARHMSSSLTGPCGVQQAFTARLEGGLAYCDIVSVADPAAERVVQVPAHEPVSPVAVYDAVLEQRPGEQNGYQQYGPGRVEG